MNRIRIGICRRTVAVFRPVLLLGFPFWLTAQPTSQANSQFNSYVANVESGLTQRHASPAGFMASEDSARLRRGELIVEKLTPESGADLDGALLHHWRGTAFAPGATAAGFERMMRDFADYPRYFSPEVTTARVIAQQGDHFRVAMRVREQHLITVVMDTDYDVAFGHLDPRHGFSISRSTRIAEIDSPGTRNERVLGPGEEHGFLWRMNTYWTYEERDGGLYMQVESVSLSRSVPAGLGWAMGPFIETVPRESLEFTLRAACNALRG